MEIQVHHTIDKPLKDAAHRAGLQPGVLVSHLLRAKLPDSGPRARARPGELQAIHEVDDSVLQAVDDFVLQHTDCSRRDIYEYFGVSLLEADARTLDTLIEVLVGDGILGRGVRADTFFAVSRD